MKRNYFILNIFILYLASTTTTAGFCAASCTGVFNPSDPTSCGKVCYHAAPNCDAIAGSNYCSAVTVIATILIVTGGPIYCGGGSSCNITGSSTCCVYVYSSTFSPSGAHLCLTCT